MRRFICLAVVVLGLLALLPERSEAGFFGRFRRPVVQNNFFGTPPVSAPRFFVPRSRFVPRQQNNFFFGVPQSDFYAPQPAGRIVIDPYTGRAFFAPY